MAMAGLLACATVASADPIPGDLTIGGSLTYNVGAADQLGDGTHSGTMTKTQSGADTSTTFSNGVPVGANPLNAAFTDTGDGLSFMATASSGSDGEYAGAGSFAMSLANSSADTYEIVVRFVFSNEATAASGLDGYASSLYQIQQPSGTNLDASLAFSDGLNGNEDSTGLLAGFGGLVAESGNFTTTITLTGPSSTDIYASWLGEGGSYETDADTLIEFSASITIESITKTSTGPGPDPVPEPGSLALMALGLAGAAIVARRRRNRE